MAEGTRAIATNELARIPALSVGNIPQTQRGSTSAFANGHTTIANRETRNAKHRGVITVESTLGQGTTFEIRLPITHR